MSIKTKLAKLDKEWDGVKQEFGDSTGGFDTIPAGNYVLHKVKAELVENSSGNLMVKQSAVVKEGDYEGQKVFSNQNIESERGPEFLLKWLNTMGIQVDSLKDDLVEALESILNNPSASFQCSVKESDGYNKIYWNKCIDEGDVENTGDNVSDSDSDSDSDCPNLDEMTRRQLKKFIKENNLSVDETEFGDDDDLRDAIETAWEEKPAEKEKPTSRSTSRRTATRSSKDDSKIIKGICDLCTAFGIEYGEEPTLSELKKTLTDYTFKEKDLDKSEVEVLKAAGLDKIIK